MPPDPDLGTVTRLPVLLAAWLLAEIAALVVVGRFLGMVAIALWLGAAVVVGLWLVQSRGLATVMRAQAQLLRGSAPAGALLDGLAGVVAGVLLLVPGPLSDVVAALLLIPALRRALLLRVLPGWPGVTRGAVPPATPGAGRGNVIDGDSRRIRD